MGGSGVIKQPSTVVLYGFVTFEILTKWVCEDFTTDQCCVRNKCIGLPCFSEIKEKESTLGRTRRSGSSGPWEVPGFFDKEGMETTSMSVVRVSLFNNERSRNKMLLYCPFYQVFWALGFGFQRHASILTTPTAPPANAINDSLNTIGSSGVPGGRGVTRLTGVR